MLAPSNVIAICYVDFSGNLDEAACGRPISELIDLSNDTPPGITVYKSSATCPGCRQVITAQLDAQFSGLLPPSACSQVARMSTSDTPAPRSIAIP